MVSTLKKPSSKIIIPQSPQVLSKEEQRKVQEEILFLESELERRRCEEKFSAFVKSAWDVLEPDNPLIWNWHLDYLCDEMEKQIHRIGQKIERDEYDVLIVNIPPRSLKSMIFTRMLAAWAWIHYSWMRFMRGSYAEELALEHAVETRDIIRSDWYQDNWGHVYQLKGDQDNKHHFRTNFNGACFTTSTTGKATGRGANVVSLDDPISPLQSESDTERAKSIRFYKRTIKSRLNNKKVDLIVIVMQRLHEEDLTGWILEHEALRIKHICLPAEDAPWVSPPELREKYVEVVPGRPKLLFPAQFGFEVLDPIKEDAYLYAGQYQQRPSPEEGGLFKRQNWRFWKPAGMDLPSVTVNIGLEIHTCIVEDLPTDFDDSLCSWDCSFKDLKSSDYVSGTVWARRGPKKYLIDRRKGKMNYSKTCKEIKLFKAQYPRTTAVLIEDKANGPAVIADVKKTISGVIAINPGSNSKLSRAMPMSRQQEAGDIYLPHPAIAPWVDDYINEFTSFPNGSHDDDVDSSDQAINYFGDAVRVWPEYSGKTLPFKINFKEISPRSLIITSIWIEKNLKTSVLYMFWNSKQGKLWVFDEYVSDNAKPDPVILKTIQVMSNVSGEKFRIEDLKRINFIGNSTMFGNAGIHNIAGTYLTSAAKLPIQENQFYDEQGAATIGSKMFSFNQVGVHNRAQLFKQQAGSWKIAGNEPEEGYGLCRAFCNTVSMLYESGTMKRREVKLREYSPAKTSLERRIQRAHDDGSIANLITGKSNSNYSAQRKDGRYI